MTYRQMMDLIILDAGILRNELWSYKRVGEVINNAVLEVQVQSPVLLQNLIGVATVSTFTSESLFGYTFKSVNINTFMSDIIGVAPKFMAVQVSSSGFSALALEVSFEGLQRLFNSAYTVPNARQPIYIVAENKIMVFPVPTSVTVRYHKKHPTLTNDSDVIQLPDEMLNQVKLKALQMIKAVMGDLQSSQNAQEDNSEKRNEIIQKTVLTQRT